MSTLDSSASSDPKAIVASELVSGLLTGDVDRVRGLYDGPGDIDDPRAGRHIDGGFESLVRTWAPATLAEVTDVQLRHSTTGAEGRFNASEFELSLRKDGAPKTLDVVVISEFAPSGGLVRNRLYYRLARLTGKQNQRYRILPEEPVHLEPFSPIMQEYQAALASGDVERMTATFSEDAIFDGHGESQDLHDGVGMGHYRSHDGIRGVLTQMFSIGDEEANHSGDEHIGTTLEKLNVFSDGKTTIVEFNIIHVNNPVNRTSAGVAAYEVGPDGRLSAARIFDEAW